MKDIFEVVLLIWLVLLVPTIFYGVVDSRVSWSKCNDPLVRIEYVVPGYKIGCWLGGIP
jgi:hypothetical protein